MIDLKIGDVVKLKGNWWQKMVVDTLFGCTGRDTHGDDIQPIDVRCKWIHMGYEASGIFDIRCLVKK